MPEWLISLISALFGAVVGAIAGGLVTARYDVWKQERADSRYDRACVLEVKEALETVLEVIATNESRIQEELNRMCSYRNTPVLERYDDAFWDYIRRDPPRIYERDAGLFAGLNVIVRELRLQNRQIDARESYRATMCVRLESDVPEPLLQYDSYVKTRSSALREDIKRYQHMFSLGVEELIGEKVLGNGRRQTHAS